MKDITESAIRPGAGASGRRWRLRGGETTGSGDLLRHLARVRGVGEQEMLAWTAPSLRQSMPDPLVLADMDLGLQTVWDTIRKGDRLAIWSDYDCDGLTAAAVMVRFLRACGAGNPPVRIPDRAREGYGPNAEGLRALRDDGIRTVVVLDAGVQAHEALEAADAAGLEIVVIDHHAPGPDLPPARAVIDPKRHDDESGLDDLCAAGLAFVFCVGLAREMRRAGWFDGRKGRPASMPQSRLLGLLDIVALGTVADVVPLKDLNRAIVARGLEVLNAGGCPGLAALVLKAGLAGPVTASDLGWKLGPRINAAGRIGDPMTGLSLLLTEDPEEAAALAEELNQLNEQRQAIEAHVSEAAMASVLPRQTNRSPVIALVEDAHEGVIGISAGRLRKELHAPALVLSGSEDGFLKGSARSVEGFDIGHAVLDAKAAGILVRGGGHRMAAGMTLKRDMLDRFRMFLEDRIIDSTFFREGEFLDIDLFLEPGEVNEALLQVFAALEPTGAGNPPARLALSHVVMPEPVLLKEKHLKFSAGWIDILAWNAAGSDLGTFLSLRTGRAVELAGSLSINEFRGIRRIQMILDDARDATEPNL